MATLCFLVARARISHVKYIAQRKEREQRELTAAIQASVIEFHAAEAKKAAEASAWAQCLGVQSFGYTAWGTVLWVWCFGCGALGTVLWCTVVGVQCFWVQCRVMKHWVQCRRAQYFGYCACGHSAWGAVPGIWCCFGYGRKGVGIGARYFWGRCLWHYAGVQFLRYTSGGTVPRAWCVGVRECMRVCACVCICVRVCLLACVRACALGHAANTTK